MKPKIIFEDKYILVVDKPSGLIVNRAKTTRNKVTLQDIVEKQFGWDWATLRALKSTEGTEVFIRRSGIVHRLDKDTSGLMIVAKTPQAFVDLQRQFKERKVIKKYIALVHGKLEPKNGDIRLPLARNIKDRKKFAIRLGGKEAVTKYKRLAVYNDFSLVELTPKTGRTHQLRVHLKAIDHPIVADPIYLGKKRLKEDLGWCLRLFLHAKYLQFNHPVSLKKVEFEIDLPEDLEKVKNDISKRIPDVASRGNPRC